MDQDEGVRIMVRALRFCQEYMSRHNSEYGYSGACPCGTCRKIRELYRDIGGDDNFHVLKEKYFS